MRILNLISIGLKRDCQNLRLSIIYACSFLLVQSAVAQPSWIVKATMPTGPRSRIAAANGIDALGVERVYIFGGESNIVEAYQISDSWLTSNLSQLTPMPISNGQFPAATGPDGRIYLFGGLNVTTERNDVLIYDPVANSWTTGTPMPTARFAAAAATAPNGRIYVFGGQRNCCTPSFLNTVEEYDPATNSWTTKTSMPVSSNTLTAVTGCDGLIYIITGFTSNVFAYDPNADSFTTLSSATSRSRFSSAAGSNGKIYLMGGILSGTFASADVQEYDIAGDTWTTIASMNSARHSHTAARLGDKVIVFGGADKFVPPPDVVESFEPLSVVAASDDAAPDAAICEGNTHTLAGSIGGGATSSTWSTSGDGTFDNATLLNATYTPGTADIAAGSVTLTLTTDDPAGPCTAVSDDMVLTINASPVTSSISGPAVVCPNATGITYFVTDNPGSYFGWAVSGGTIVSGQGRNSITVDWGASGTGLMNVLQTDANGCVASQVFLTVTISTPSTSSISGPTTVCTNATGVGYSVTPTTGSTYNWSVTGGTIASGQGTSSITVDWGASGSGFITVVETNAGGCSGSLVNLTVTISVPSTSSISGPITVCENTTGVGYSVTSTTGSTYAWTVTGGTIASGQGTNGITVDWGAAGSGFITVVETNAGGCSGSLVNLTVTISVPSTSSISGPITVCENTTGVGYSVTLTAGSTYNWTVTGGTIASGQGTNSIIVDWGSAGAGNVSVVETNVNGCPGSTVNLAVTIITGPTTSVITGSASVCENSNGEVYSVVATTGSTYQWTITGGSVASGQGTNSITVDWGAAGSGTVSVVETNANGCAGSPVNLSVTINLNPTTSAITGPAIVCENATGVGYSVTFTTGSVYAWTATGGTIASGQGTNSITIDWGSISSGTGEVLETNSFGCTGNQFCL